LALIDAAAVAYGEGQILMSATTQGTIEMASVPANPPVAETILVPLWASNLTALRAEMFCNWQLVRPDGVAFVSGIS
jgi:hypothetical protein